MDININSAQNVYQLPEIKVMVVGPSSGKTTWINNMSGNESNFTPVTSRKICKLPRTFKI